jgi:signal transduction histidine kinase
MIGALTIVAADILKHPLADEMATAARTVQTILSDSSPSAKSDQLEQEAVTRAARPGIVILPLPPRPHGLPTVGPPPQEPFDLRSFIVPTPIIVTVRDRSVVIIPDERRIGWAVQAYFRVVVLAIIIVIPLAWMVGAWITRQVIDPLTAVTHRLLQFAAGDFTPQPLNRGDRAEIGALIEAYNGAAAQVALAFDERKLSEEHMRRFVADAGHELRTPLSSISASHDILRKYVVADSPTLGRVFNTLRGETQRMNGLIDGLISLARLERPEYAQPECIDMRELAQDTIAAITSARGGDIILDSSEDVYAFADRGDVYDALGNLIDNAVKYGAGTTVRVNIEREADEVVATVCDGGPGIPPGDRMHIFDRFYRGWIGRGKGGSGLGLAIAHQAIERAGGDLQLISGEPEMTTFRFSLPYAGQKCVRAENGA